jgi:NADH-quinone oxidoreductase subunit J
MDTQAALFYAFSAVLLFASFRVITAKNTVYAALFLVLAFFSAACIWMLLKAEFLAITLVLVYVGAVMVLFLFVVMMLDVNEQGSRKEFWKYFPVAGVVGVVIAVEMALVLMNGFGLSRAPGDAPPVAAAPAVQIRAGGQVIAQTPGLLGTEANGTKPVAKAAAPSNTKELGKLLYSEYIYPLQIAAVILLVAIIAAIALTLRRRKDSKYVSPSDQVRVKAADRVRIVKLEPTAREAEGAAK